MDGSPALVVMGGDSCPEGGGVESQHCILGEHFSHIFVVKILMFVLKLHGSICFLKFLIRSVSSSLTIVA